jgi:hypothetical protein
MLLSSTGVLIVDSIEQHTRTKWTGKSYPLVFYQESHAQKTSELKKRNMITINYYYYHQ